MDADSFRKIEKALHMTHGQTATALGVSEVSVKRYATQATPPIPAWIKRGMIALVLVHAENLEEKYQKLLRKYGVVDE